MSPFEFINTFFNPDEYRKINNNTKNSMYWIVNRFMSIQFPTFAAMLSNLKISGSGVMDYWQSVLYKQYKSAPNWLFLSGSKNRAEKKKAKTYQPTIEAKQLYCKINNCTLTDIKDAYVFFPDEIDEELKDIDDYLNGKKIEIKKI